MFCEHCVRARIIFHNITSKYNSTFILLVFLLQFSILQMTYVHQWRKMYFTSLFLASSITSDLFLTFARFHVEIFSSFLHSLSTAFFASGNFIAWGTGKICAPYCNDAVNYILFLQSGLREFLVQFLPHAASFLDSSASKIDVNLDLWLAFVLRVTPCLLLFVHLQGMAGAVGISNFFPWIPHPQVQWNKYLEVFGHFPALVLHLPKFASLSF